MGDLINGKPTGAPHRYGLLVELESILLRVFRAGQRKRRETPDPASLSIRSARDGIIAAVVRDIVRRRPAEEWREHPGGETARTFGAVVARLDPPPTPADTMYPAIEAAVHEFWLTEPAEYDDMDREGDEAERCEAAPEEVPRAELEPDDEGSGLHRAVVSA